MIVDLKVESCCYHRNGISGLGFWALEFNWKESGYNHRRKAVGTVDDEDVKKFVNGERYNPGTRVIMLNKANEPCIEETMRGDHFHEELCKFIVQYQKRN